MLSGSILVGLMNVCLRRHQQLNHIIATNLGKALVNGSVFDTVMLHTRAAHEDITAFLDKGF